MYRDGPARGGSRRRRPRGGARAARGEWARLRALCAGASGAAAAGAAREPGPLPAPPLAERQLYASLARLGVPVVACADEADQDLARDAAAAAGAADARAAGAPGAVVLGDDSDFFFFRGARYVELARSAAGPRGGRARRRVEPRESRREARRRRRGAARRRARARARARAPTSPSVLISLLSYPPPLHPSLARAKARLVELAALLGNDYTRELPLSAFDGVAVDGVAGARGAGGGRGGGGGAASARLSEKRRREPAALRAWLAARPAAWRLAARGAPTRPPRARCASRARCAKSLEPRSTLAGFSGTKLRPAVARARARAAGTSSSRSTRSKSTRRPRAPTTAPPVRPPPPRGAPPAAEDEAAAAAPAAAAGLRALDRCAAAGNAAEPEQRAAVARMLAIIHARAGAGGRAAPPARRARWADVVFAHAYQRFAGGGARRGRRRAIDPARAARPLRRGAVPRTPRAPARCAGVRGIEACQLR